ncbi:MAG: GNAT family N-acetyltransferase [Gammaproteobacteria bacterium]
MAGADNPFASHAFLSALEDSGAVGAGTAWEPHHLVATRDDGALTGILPLYLKHDSFGEFVFDWAWAEAWHRAGRAYYPKLIAATPYSPVGAPKLLLSAGADAQPIVDAALGLVEDLDASSLHWLFVEDALTQVLVESSHLLRNDCQYHWQNDGYRDFDDFLTRFRSAKRKALRRERKLVAASGLVIRRHSGTEIDDALWTRLHALTARSFHLRGNPHYLSAACYRLLGERLGDAVQAFVAWDDDRPVACALCIDSNDVLFGRYWGAEVNVPGLHFELCYYQGIEYCIERKRMRFEPGAQGEHKLARGFEPVRTVSAHWVRDGELRAPVADWCRREREMVADYMESARNHLPFHRDE